MISDPGILPLAANPYDLRMAKRADPRFSRRQRRMAQATNLPLDRARLTEWREFKGLKNEELAEKMHRAPSTVSKLINKKMKLTEGYLIEFAAAWEVTPKDLFESPTDQPSISADDLLRDVPVEDRPRIIEAIRMLISTRR